MENKRGGFIGPLGDDIPSIFPIIAGVLIFIVSVFYITGQQQQRNAYLDLRGATLRMSYIVTEKGLMGDVQFQEKCGNELKDFASKNSMEFAVILKKYCGPITFAGEENQKIVKRTVGTETIVDKVCSSNTTIAGTTAEESVFAKPILFPSKDTIVMSYPIAVECGGALRGLGLISVAGWRVRK